MELPRLKPLFEAYRERGLEIIAIDRTNDTVSAREFIEENGFGYTFLENGEAEKEVVKALFGVSTYPTSYLIDQEGRIRWVHVGFEAGDEVTFEEKIVSLLEG